MKRRGHRRYSTEFLKQHHNSDSTSLQEKNISIASPERLLLCEFSCLAPLPSLHPPLPSSLPPPSSSASAPEGARHAWLLLPRLLAQTLSQCKPRSEMECFIISTLNAGLTSLPLTGRELFLCVCGLKCVRAVKRRDESVQGNFGG